MTLAPLTNGPHLVPANRLAFTTPVREAGGAGHWITLHSAEDPESGTCHVWVNGGSGPGSGTIGKGPKSLVGKHIAALASHPSVSKAQHHPVGHEPPGARDHPHYAEAQPGDRRQATGDSDGELAKRPGKPYARLSGADQGTRAEQIGKALGEAQEAAKGASQKAEAERAARRRQMADDQAARNRDVTSTGHQAFIGEHEYFHLPSGDLVRAPRDRRLDENGHRVGARGVAPAHRATQTLRQHIVDAAERGEPLSGPATQRNAIADTAVAHQQAQADLAAHRSKADRNPNPWAPHLSPPVGDAKDRELAEKATRAQLAHQAAQAQQQGAQQAQQTEGQRAHEKEMVRLKAETVQPKAEAKPQAKVRPAKPTDKPWDYVSPAAQKRMDAAKAEQARKAADEERRNLEGALIHNAQYAHHAFTRDRAQSHAAMQDRLMAEHREKHGDEANRQLKELMDTARYAGRRYEGYRNASELVRQDVDAARQRQQQPKAEPKGAFTAPGAKEKPQTAPQPEQPAGAHNALTTAEREQVAGVLKTWQGADKGVREDIAQRHEAAAKRGGAHLAPGAHREAARLLREQTARPAPSGAMPRPVHHMTEDEYVAHSRARDLALHHMLVERAHEERALVPPRAASSTHERAARTLADAQQDLQEHGERHESGRHVAYRHAVKDAIKKGHEVPAHILDQRPEFRKTYDKHTDERRRRASFYGHDVRESTAPALRFSAPAAPAR